jgi:hypothetical protein
MMTPTTRAIATILGAGLVAALTAVGSTAGDGQAGATEKLTLWVTPSVSSAPTNLTVKATIAKDRANRWLSIAAESGSFYRSSEIQLDGDKAPAVTEIRLRNLPSGEYAITAVLRNNLGGETRVQRSALVLSRFTSGAF